MPGPLDREGCVAKGIYTCENSGEENLQLGHSRPSQFP